MNDFIFCKDLYGIEGLSLVEMNCHNIKREPFFCTYDISQFHEYGLNQCFVQDNEAFSKQNVLRGMHVNVLHPQGKLIRVLKGKIYDVVIDLRKESKTYKKWIGIELSDNNKKSLYIPERMGHGYLAMEDSLVDFKVTTHYIVNDEIGFAWNSKDFHIKWPIKDFEIIQNDKDKTSKDFSELNY